MTLTPLLSIHIASAILGLVSGFTALLSAKGQRRHRRAGNLFLISMLTMSASGCYLGWIKDSMVDVVAGLGIFYLVASGWLTVVRGAGRVGPLEYGLLLIAVIDMIAAALLGSESLRGATGLEEQAPAIACGLFGSILFLAAFFDVRLLIKGGISGMQRIARHLWRVCLATLYVSISFFLPTRFSLPDFLTFAHLNLLPILFVLASMIFWRLRIRHRGSHLRRANRGDPDPVGRPAARPAVLRIGAGELRG